MKQLLFLMMLLAVLSNQPYAFVFGSKSDLEHVYIAVSLPGDNWTWPSAVHVGHDEDKYGPKGVSRGNKGRDSEWNWKDIENQSKGRVKRGDKLNFRIYTKRWYKPDDFAYQGQIASDGRFGFVVKRSKDARNVDVYTVVPDQEAINEYVPADTVSAPASSVPATRIKCYILRATYGSGSKQADVTAILTNLTNTKLTKNESFNFSGGNGSFNKLFGDPSVGEAKQLFIEFKDEKGMVKTKTIQEDQPFTLP